MKKKGFRARDHHHHPIFIWTIEFSLQSTRLEPLLLLVGDDDDELRQTLDSGPDSDSAEVQDLRSYSYEKVDP
jgi:hypothetical protein